MKKAVSILLLIALLLGLGTTAFAATTVRSHQALKVDGDSVSCDIYNIDGSNYFKLRDLAYLMNGTGSQFAVGYDPTSNCVTITTGAAYTPSGSELVIGEDQSSTAVQSAQTIFVDGQLCDNLSVYNIGGNNYFKLRDLGSAVGFSVDYDTASQTMLVETTEAPGAADQSLLTATFLDCGQGDAALISCDGHHMLIDGGGKSKSQYIYSVLQSLEITHLDLIVATHPHEDHIGGIPAALSYADADMTLCNVTEYPDKEFSDFKRYADEKGGGITVPQVGDTYSFGSAAVQILSVNAGEENDSSIVLKITHGQNTFLFMGDAEAETERSLLLADAPLTSTVLKVGHHGADASSSVNFLSNVTPRYAVISVGKDNTYAHPSATVLDRLNSVGAAILRTDLHGSIVMTSDGITLSVDTEKQPDAQQLLIGGTVPDSDAHGSGDNSGSDSYGYYIINRNSGVFHNPNCPSVDRMKESNRMPSEKSRDELIRAGYTPCNNCKP